VSVADAPPEPSTRTSSRLARSVLLPLGIVVVVVLAAYLWRPNLVVSTLTSPAALAFLIGAILVAVGVRYAVTRLTGSALAGRLAQLVPLGVIVWLVLVPTVFPTTVDEAAPTGSPAAPPAPGGPTAVEPTELGRAEFRPLDHDVSGQAVLIRVGDELTVRFENFTVEPGPDYFVHVVPGADAIGPDGGTEIGKLKATSGNQNYAVPAGVSTSPPQTVLIWCRAFQVPVAHATLPG
jgi:Electron transfer DM13